jgi:hypothetical protein
MREKVPNLYGEAFWLYRIKSGIAGKRQREWPSGVTLAMAVWSFCLEIQKSEKDLLDRVLFNQSG